MTAYDRGNQVGRCGSKLETALRGAESRLRVACGKWKEEIREHPGKAVFLAAAGGYVCHRLHARSLLFTGLKILAAFTPPTLFALGLCRVAEICKVRDAEWSGSADNETAPSSAEASTRILVTDA